MKLFDKKSLILLISVVSINLLCIISVSYAYFTANIKGNDTAKEMKVKAGSMEITYTDSDEVSLNNAIPGDSITKQFKVENTGTLDAKYNIKVSVNTNEFEDYSDLTYILTKNGTPAPEQVLPYEDGYISINNEIKSTAIDTYSLKVTFKNDTVDIDQNDNANKKVDFTIEVDSKDNVSLYEYKEPYKDNSGANRPKLYQGMIPITFNDDNTMKIADITQEWYNYDEHEWGNAVLIDNTNQDIVNKFYNEDGTLKINDPITEEDILQMYVWIPRYKYQLFNAVNGNSIEPQEIQIQFEKGVTSTGNVSCTIASDGKETCQNDINGNWYTHPAFTFGGTELSGIWVGKFESSHTTKSLGNDSSDLNAILNCSDNSCNESASIRILPNKSPLRYNNISNFFYVSRSIEKINNIYNLDSFQIDTHIMRNMEWGAMVYLTQSKYGRCTDGECVEVTKNAQTYVTGYDDNGNLWNTSAGQLASATGNMYGIYDTNGDAWEYAMGNMVDASGGYYASESELASVDEKYYDKYEYDENSRTTHQRGHLGDATRETMQTFGNVNGGWYNDRALFVSITYSWFMRGGRAGDTVIPGIFAFHRELGGGSPLISFRVAITAQDGNE